MLLGYIRDFSLEDGDRIFTAAGRDIHVDGLPPSRPTDTVRDQLQVGAGEAGVLVAGANQKSVA